MCPLSDGKCRIGAIHRQTHRCMFKCKIAAPMCDSGQFGQVYTDILPPTVQRHVCKFT